MGELPGWPSHRAIEEGPALAGFLAVERNQQFTSYGVPTTEAAILAPSSPLSQAMSAASGLPCIFPVS